MGGRMRLVVAAIAAALLTVPAGSAAAAEVEWGACPPSPRLDPRQECASLPVPLDYSAPSGATIEIAISRLRTASPGERRGILLYNPGGPGSSGIYGPSRLAGSLPQSVLDRYDLVGFDPRGINFSAPVSCSLAPDDLDVLKFIPYPAYDLDISANVAYAQRAAAGCAATSGALLPHITTANTARDMDEIRAAFHEPKISYVGYSYGTYLGAVYTQLFPERTDRFILDSVIHPRRIWRETFAAWGYAVEVGFEPFTRFAAERDATYGLGATPRAVYEKTLELIGELEAEPFPFPGTDIVITGDSFRELIRNDGLRNDRSFPGLAEVFAVIDARAISAGMSPGAVELLRRTERPTATQPSAAVAGYPAPPPDNPFASPWAVVCGDADWPESPQTYQRAVRLYDRLFPIHGRAAANIWPCASWRFEPRDPAVEIGELRGGGKALLVQSVRDPATPYDGGVAMRLTLGARSRLVSVADGAHVVAFNAINGCADEHATAFLVAGALPQDTFCPRDVELDGASRLRRDTVADGLLPQP
jgi:pimeloyl-ACP methyl ester carboxylesterase